MVFEEFMDIVSEAFGGLTEKQTGQFRMLQDLYTDWNSKINVISRKDIGELYSHHVLHSLAIARYLKMAMPAVYEELRSPAGNVRLLDIGTGGGFPGIPLAILFPGGKFTLCDSIGKKIKVASAVAASIGLDNAVTVNARAEALTGKFDFTKGRFSRGILYLKGGDIAEELGTAMRKFNIRPGSVHTWKVDTWLQDEYFEGKMVIFFEGKGSF